MRRIVHHRPARSAMAVGALLALGACGGDSGGAPARVEAAVAISDVRFTPDDVTIAAGRAVQWTNTSATERHNIVAVVKGSFAEHTSLLKRGEQVTIRFAKPGEYAYYCSLHGSPTGGQRGIVRVTPVS